MHAYVPHRNPARLCRAWWHLRIQWLLRPDPRLGKVRVDVPVLDLAAVVRPEHGDLVLCPAQHVGDEEQGALNVGRDRGLEEPARLAERWVLGPAANGDL